MVGGGIISRRPCTFSGDGKLVLTPSNNVINIYSAVTGERINVLEGHTDDVTAVILNPENPSQVYSSSLDGKICLWDYLEGKCLSTIEVKQAVVYMVIHKELRAAYLSVQMREGQQTGRVFLASLDDDSTPTPKTKGMVPRLSRTAMKLRKASPLALSPSGKFAATIDKQSLLVWRTGTDINQPLNLHHTKAYTCLAFHPDDSIIAVGDVSGRILLWRDFAEHVPAVRKEGSHSGNHQPTTPPPLTTVHWHSQPVSSLAFSPDGTQLMSGGHEGTLVTWLLAENQMKPSFLPRLGGPLTGIHISPEDPAKVVIRQANNALLVVNTATLKVETSIFGIRPPPPGIAQSVSDSCAHVVAASSVPGAGPGRQLLVLPAEGCHLQWYDPIADKHVRLLQVVARNANQTAQAAGALAGSIAKAQQGQTQAEVGVTTQPFIQNVAFSPDASTIVTVDVKPTGYSIPAGALSGPSGTGSAGYSGQKGTTGPFSPATGEACLKFWSLLSTGEYVINTRIEEAHNGSIHSVAYHPSMDLVVTTGGGGGAEWDFRVWVKESRKRTKEDIKKNNVSDYWRCRSVAGYRNRPLTATAFSSDGSVLAIAAGNKVTLWDAMENSLVAVLPSVTSAGVSSNGLGVSAASAVLGSNSMAGAAVIRDLVFVPGTPFLAAATVRGVTVYNILTADVHWSLPANVLSVAVDTGRGLLAVAVGALPRGIELSQSLPAGEPQQHQLSISGKQQNQQQQAVVAPVVVPVVNKLLLFDPASPAPLYHSTLPSGAFVKLVDMKAAPPPPEQKLLIPQASPSLAGRVKTSIAKPKGSKDVAAPGLSMLVLLDGRRYLHARLSAADGSSGAELASTSATGVEGAEGAAAVAAAVAPSPSAFADMFGALGSGRIVQGSEGPQEDDAELASIISNDLAIAVLEAAEGALAGGDGAPNFEEASTSRTRNEWRNKLFEGPSHTLPAPTDLVETFLAGLLAGSVNVH